jgi:hypothetical protein
MAVEIKTLDSVTKLTPDYAGSVLVGGSHGGVYCAYLAAAARVRGLILSDAGVGKDQAGIGSLAYMEKLGTPAATVSHVSARIGDVADMMSRGRISHVNEVAAALGCAAGQTCREAAERMREGSPPAGEPPAYAESRFLLSDGAVKVWGIDSNSLTRPEDAGQIVVTGSHGALLAGKPETAIRVDALAAVYNDAGIGIDEVGISRLPALDQRGIAGATVGAASARIGDARSAWETGLLSAVNRTAEARGARLGMTVPEFAEAVRKSLR